MSMGELYESIKDILPYLYTFLCNAEPYDILQTSVENNEFKIWSCEENQARAEDILCRLKYRIANSTNLLTDLANIIAEYVPDPVYDEFGRFRGVKLFGQIHGPWVTRQHCHHIDNLKQRMDLMKLEFHEELKRNPSESEIRECAMVSFCPNCRHKNVFEKIFSIRQFYLGAPYGASMIWRTSDGCISSARTENFIKHMNGVTKSMTITVFTHHQTRFPDRTLIYTTVFSRLHGRDEELRANGSRRHIARYWFGKLHGLCQEWHDNGQERLCCTYEHGKMTGQYKSWYRNGQLKDDFVYADDKPHGFSFEYDEDGTIIRHCNWHHGTRVYLRGKD